MTPEFGWEELLDFVRGRHVVSRGAQRTPRHRDRGRRALLHTHLGARLAAHLGLEQGDFSNGTDLSQVAFRFLRGGGDRPRLYRLVERNVDEEVLPIPAALRQLAAISDFTLFVTTTFDPFLVRAIDQARFGGHGPHAGPRLFTISIGLPRRYPTPVAG